jgi:hypothetical protein
MLISTCSRWFAEPRTVQAILATTAFLADQIDLGGAERHPHQVGGFAQQLARTSTAAARTAPRARTAAARR